GSFKDRGMTVGASHAKLCGASLVACASTGNTAASMAAYAATGDLSALIFVPETYIAYGKLSQSLAYGAKTVAIKGDFDAAMTIVRQIASETGIYILNSVNPFRVEGQKSIIFELLQQLHWSPPDWIVLPGGNLANAAAFGKALLELRELGLLQRIPRLAVIQAQGANPFYRAYREGFQSLEPVRAQTLASAIRIGNPVSYPKAKRAIIETNGIVEQATDQEILDAKAQVDRAGIGCEPASAASIAGVKKLVGQGTIRKGEHVVAILTGHMLKDPDTTLKYHLGQLSDISGNFANPPTVLEPELTEVLRFLERTGFTATVAQASPPGSSLT
ncbi:MAG: threonine synthase, partial [Chloroflexi bacterium]|nr:threonine synthase [Chloroflexota bacterium]